MSITGMKTMSRAVLLALPCLIAAQGALATPGDLKLTKIALHLVPGAPQPGSCSQVVPSGCADTDLYYDPGFQIIGTAEKLYTLYILATDINTTAGLKRVSFTIECDPDVLMPIVYEPQWCANATMTPDWPYCGSTIDIEFPTCVGTSPDPADPEGDGTVLLGVCGIGGSGMFAIGSLERNERTAQVADCAGETTELTWTDGMDSAGIGRVSLGEVGFGIGEGHLFGACRFPGMADDACAAGWSTKMWACCLPGVGCAGGLSQISPRACAFAGGVWSVVRCGWVCNDEDCRAVPVRSATWGMIKSMYQ